MEGDDPRGAVLQRHWVAKRPVGLGLAVWRHGTQVRDAYDRVRTYNRRRPDVIDTALGLETELAKGERIGTLDAFADDNLQYSTQVPNGDFEEPMLHRVKFTDSKKLDNVTHFKSPASSSAYYPCWPFVGLEIVKENGSYIVLENGRRIVPSRMSPEQKHVFDRLVMKSDQPGSSTAQGGRGQSGAIVASDGQPADEPSSIQGPDNDGEDEDVALQDARVDSEMAAELRPTHGSLYYRLNTPPQLLTDGAVHRLHDPAVYQSNRGGELDDARVPLKTWENEEKDFKSTEAFALDQYTESSNNWKNQPLIPLDKQGGNGARAFPKRFPAPLATRVRVEVGQLPPDAVKVTARSVTIGLIDEATGSVEVVEDEPIAEFGIPVGSAAEPATEAAVLPYPLSVPVPPRTVLVSQEPRRREIVERWKRGAFKSDTRTGLLSYVSAPKFEFSFSPWAMVMNKVRYDWWWNVQLWLDVARGVGATVRQRLRQQRLKARATEQAEGVREFTYGDDSKNVFDDIRDDLAEIRAALRAADDAVENPKRKLSDVAKDYVLNVTSMTDLTGELTNTEVDGARISKLKGRTRALADFLFPALWFDPDPINADAIKEQLPTALPKHLPSMRASSVTAAAARIAGKALTVLGKGTDPTSVEQQHVLGALDARDIPNYAKNEAMMPFHQSSKRSDLRYDIEINDSQFDMPLKMVLVAREQAGLMAGRVVDDHDALEQSFQNLADDLVNFVIDVEERINYHKDGYFAMVSAGAEELGRQVRRQSYRFGSTNPTARSEDGEDKAVPGPAKNGAKEWFVDRMVLQRATVGYRKMAKQFEVNSIFARMRELLGMDVFPQARIPSFRAPKDDRKAYEMAKRSDKFLLDRELNRRPETTTSSAIVVASGSATAQSSNAKSRGLMREMLAMMNATPLFANLNVTTVTSEDAMKRAYDSAGFVPRDMSNYRVDVNSGIPMHAGEQTGDSNKYPQEMDGHAYANVFFVPSLVKQMVPPLPNIKSDHSRAQRADLPQNVLERRLPQLVKLRIPFSMRGWEPLAGSTDVAPGGAMSDLAPLAAACRRASRFLGQQIRALVDKEIDAVGMAEPRSNGDPAARATDAGTDAPVRRRLQFVSLYELEGKQRESMDNLQGAARCVPLPGAFAPPTLPLGASLPHAVSRQFHASLRIMYGNAALLMEDVLGSREAVPDVVASEARNAFASILINCQLARADARSDAMAMHDVVQSVVQQARQVASEASRLIKAVYDFGNAAVLADGDELFRTLAEGPVTRLALRHTPAWQTRAEARHTALRSSVWRFHVRAFADALQTFANGKLSNPLLLPLLNVQTSWLGVRPEGPLPSPIEIRTFAQLNVYEAKRSLVRALVVDAADTVREWSGSTVVRALMFADLVLARPVLWRIEAACAAQNDTQLFTSDVSEQLLDEVGGRQVTTPAVLFGELVSAWAARRVALPLRLLTAPLSVADDGLVTALDAGDDSLGGLAFAMAQCNLDGSGIGDAQAPLHSRLSRRRGDECVYFVPVCCAVWTKMECEFDSSMGMQHVPVSRMQTALAGVSASPPENSELVETLVISQFGSKSVAEDVAPDPAAVGKTEHPLLVFHNSEANTLRVHIPPTQTPTETELANADQAVLSLQSATPPVPLALPPRSLRDCMGLLDVLAQVRDQSDKALLATRDERVDRVAATLVDTRRSVLYAVDRVYQALLHSCMVRGARELSNGRAAQPQGDGPEQAAATAARPSVLDVIVQSRPDRDGASESASLWMVNAAKSDEESKRTQLENDKAPKLDSEDPLDKRTLESMRLPHSRNPFLEQADGSAAQRDQSRVDHYVLAMAGLIAQSLIPDSFRPILLTFTQINTETLTKARDDYALFHNALHKQNADVVLLGELASFVATRCIRMRTLGPGTVTVSSV